MLPLQYILPLCPSTNALFTRRKGSQQRIKTDEYRAWLTEAGWRIAPNAPLRPIKQCSVQIDAGINYRRDLDNCAKPILDLLKWQRVIVDDRWIEDLRIVRVPGDTIAVTIAPMIAGVPT